MRIGRFLAIAAAETLWTTRCIVCDTPGAVLCERCRRALPYIDRWQACPNCGSPHGRLQCVDCNSFSLAQVGRSRTPFDRCISAIEHRGAARRVVTGFKDAGEQRLARDIAHVLHDALPENWVAPGVTVSFVPADRRARRRRGFDHMSLVANELARATGLPCLPLLEKRAVSDQRGLGRAERFQNMVGAVRPSPALAGMRAPERVLLLDDVYTTGATLFAASDALRAAGVANLNCATFARVG